MLAGAAEQFLSHRDELASLLSREHGKTFAEAATEISVAAGILSWHSGQAGVLADDTTHDARGRMVRRRVPMGVVVVIVPWNYPVLVPQLMIAPALLAGNTVVVKLPDHSPLALATALRRFADLLPAGVLNVLAGERLPPCAKVAFTGSSATGRAIMRAAIGTLKSLSLELGGNDAAVVLADTTIDDTLVAELLAGTLTAAGQACYAPKRIYVHNSLKDEFCAAFTTAASSIATSGDPATGQYRDRLRRIVHAILGQEGALSPVRGHGV